METRQITEVKIWKLVMNPMTSNTETSNLVAWSDDRERLINWYNSQKLINPIIEEGLSSFPSQGNSHNWHKTFTIGGPLEWYNPIDDFNHPNYYDQGLMSEWVNESILHQIRVGIRI